MDKIAICCIGKNENRYINEFLIHYKSLGTTKIFLYDNNDIDGEHFEEVIPPILIEEGFVQILNWRGRKECQTDAYDDCYNNYQKDFDWMAFFDIDEYFASNKTGSIVEFVSQDKFKPYDVIHLHWLVFGDNENVYYEDKPLFIRFPQHIIPIDKVIGHLDDGGNAPEISYVKSIVRCNVGKKDIFSYNSTAHSPHSNNVKEWKCCNCLGIEEPNFDVVPNVYYKDGSVADILFTEGCLKHYTTKSAQEYAWKMQRGFPDYILTKEKQKDRVWSRFFRTNTWSQKKQDVIEEILGFKC